MSKLYEVEYISNIFKELYTEMDAYFINIFDAPSTINRIIKYYAIGLPEDPLVFKRYIVFNGKIIKEFNIMEMMNMTERYTLTNNGLVKDNSWKTVLSMKDVIERLNGHYDDTQRLKKENSILKNNNMKFVTEIVRIEKELEEYPDWDYSSEYHEVVDSFIRKIS